MGIDELRKEVDRINRELVGLLGERAEVVKKIGEFKRENGLNVLDSGREGKVFGDVRGFARENGLDEGFVEKVFHEIVEESKRIQKLL